jgi:hypothetical protein
MSNLSVDEALDAYAGLLGTAACRTAYECPEQDPFFTLQLSRFGSQQACNMGAAEVFGVEGELDQLALAIEEGRVEFDQTVAETCLEKAQMLIANADPCSALGALDDGAVAECDQVFTGKGVEGSACADSQECGDGFYCEFSADDTMCYGTCAPDEGGEECGGQICDEATQFCDENDACVAHKEQGAACFGDEECGSFESDAYCDYTQPSEPGGFDGTCGTLYTKTAGSDCEFDDECAEGLGCSDDTDTCEAVAAITFGPMGSTCVLSEEGPLCEPGLVCGDLAINMAAGQIEGSCQPPKAMGGSCYLDFECGIDAVCAGADFQSMTQGSCGPRLANGASCENNLQCESANCEFGENDEGTCAALMICMLPE